MKPIDFFKKKRSWSVMKDRILGQYLVPYVNKLKQFKRMVVIVDGFAGCGLYDDGTEGSPIIIAKILENYIKKGIKVFGIFIENDRDCFKELEKNIESYKKRKIVTAEFEDFRKITPEIIKIANNLPMFFYIDPFGLVGLEFAHLEEIFKKTKRSSTEVLINFNYRVFNREVKASPKLIKKVMNGNYYEEILKNIKISGAEKEKMILEKYTDLYRKYFKYVGYCPVMYKDEQRAKYYLIFATSHFDGLELMNDIMGNVYREFFSKGRLFDAVPLEKSRDLEFLKKVIIDVLRETGTKTRSEIKKILMPKLFMRYTAGDFGKLISGLIKEEKIYSENGKARINDSIKVSLTKF